VDYGNGTESDWIGPVNSGDVVGFNCSWESGIYKIRVKAKDINGNEGAWSDTLKITVKSTFLKNANYLSFLERFLNLLDKIGFINVNN
jgi:hypothetical protein